MKKIEIREFIENNDKILSILGALIVIFPISFVYLQSINQDYAGYFAITCVAAIFILVHEIVKDENLSFVTNLFVAMIVAMPVIFALIIKDFYGNQVQTVAGFIILGGAFLLGLYLPNKLFEKMGKIKKHPLFIIIALIIGLITFRYEKEILSYLIQLSSHSLSINQLSVLSTFYGGIVFYVAVVGTLYGAYEILRFVKERLFTS